MYKINLRIYIDFHYICYFFYTVKFILKLCNFEYNINDIPNIINFVIILFNKLFCCINTLNEVLASEETLQ